jgi:N6-adenosine-specific RNA methylase IME4
MTTATDLRVLDNFDKAKSLIAQANLTEAIKGIAEADALKSYAEAINKGTEIQNMCAELKIGYERRAGELLSQMEKNKGGNPNLAQDGISCPPTYKELGIERHKAERWQMEASVPEDKFQQHITEIKESGKELTSAGVLKIAQKIVSDNKPKETPPLPTDIFNVIYADPPWKYDNQIESWGPTSLHYQTMTIEEICAVKVPSADNAVLFMWVTNPFARDAFTVIDAWGFEYKTNIVWVKRNLTKPGSGFYVRGRHELLFICTKGSFVPDMKGREPIGSVLEADVREHSQKPPEAYELIENIYPDCKYLELFARNSRPGWISWGNEIAAEV